MIRSAAVASLILLGGCYDFKGLHVSRGACIDRMRGGQSDRVIEQVGRTMMVRIDVERAGRPS